jgi:hypothetical protein
MCAMSNGVEFVIGPIDTLTCANGQLELEFSAPLVEELHKFEQLCIPDRC